MPENANFIGISVLRYPTKGCSSSLDKQTLIRWLDRSNGVTDYF